MKNILRNNRGFTLLEILVTVGIVGVLSAIAVPAYNQYKSNANETAVKIDVGNSQKAYLAKDAVDGSFCHSLSAVGLSSVGQSDIYRGADKAHFGFTSACGSVVATSLKADIKQKSAPSTSVPAMGTSNSCTITSSTFELGGGFEKGNTKVGYYIGNEDAGPTKSTNAAGSCTGSGCSAHTTQTPCDAAAGCSWNAGGISDVCG